MGDVPVGVNKGCIRASLTTCAIVAVLASWWFTTQGREKDARTGSCDAQPGGVELVNTFDH
jgi:hypothetical protein